MYHFSPKKNQQLRVEGLAEVDRGIVGHNRHESGRHNNTGFGGITQCPGTTLEDRHEVVSVEHGSVVRVPSKLGGVEDELTCFESNLLFGGRGISGIGGSH